MLPSTAAQLGEKRAAIARASRRAKHSPDDESAARQLAVARRDYYAASLERYIERTVAAAPDLTPEQRDRLALLLRPTSGTAA